MALPLDSVGENVHNLRQIFDDFALGLVQVQSRFEPEVWSTQYLDLDLPKWVRSTPKLAQTLGPLCSVQSGPWSARARTKLQTVYAKLDLKLW